MIKLNKSGYDYIYKMYLTNDFFFPLIAAVLLDDQDGVVYVDDPISPSQAYVEHAFGFAQVFGTSVTCFEQELARYWLTDKCFKPGKIRLYAPYLPGFLALPEYESLRSSRQRFTLDPADLVDERPNPRPDNNLTFGGVDLSNISLIDNKFDVVGRFWKSQDDFIKKSNAVVVFKEGKPASICYAAAEADHRVEIDVLTLPEYRNMGLAKLAVTGFIKRCFSLSLSPLWDCFTNNPGSLMLCKSVGFLPYQPPYPFFTINK
jgi:hypothetical protein